MATLNDLLTFTLVVVGIVGATTGIVEVVIMIVTLAMMSKK